MELLTIFSFLEPRHAVSATIGLSPSTKPNFSADGSQLDLLTLLSLLTLLFRPLSCYPLSTVKRPHSPYTSAGVKRLQTDIWTKEA